MVERRSTDKRLIPCRWECLLFATKLRQQSGPFVDGLIASAAEVLDNRESVHDFLLRRFDRLGKAGIRFLLRHVRTLRVAAGRRRLTRQGRRAK